MTTIHRLRELVHARKRMLEIQNERPNGRLGIAVHDDPLALEWQRLDHVRFNEWEDMADALPALLDLWEAAERENQICPLHLRSKVLAEALSRLSTAKEAK